MSSRRKLSRKEFEEEIQHMDRNDADFEPVDISVSDCEADRDESYSNCKTNQLMFKQLQILVRVLIYNQLQSRLLLKKKQYMIMNLMKEPISHTQTADVDVNEDDTRDVVQVKLGDVVRLNDLVSVNNDVITFKTKDMNKGLHKSYFSLQEDSDEVEVKILNSSRN
ncbi:hypothetical protein FQA39_LY01885 [Lamprigera yunnana]|nr:hypothetical protein FQA39_LY01885 [Lamprigera yunnana]